MWQDVHRASNFEVNGTIVDHWPEVVSSLDLSGIRSIGMRMYSNSPSGKVVQNKMFLMSMHIHFAPSFEMMLFHSILDVFMSAVQVMISPLYSTRFPPTFMRVRFGLNFYGWTVHTKRVYFFLYFGI